MSCEKYKQLDMQLQSAKRRYSQFAYEANRHLWGVSERERNRIVKEELGNLSKYNNEMFQHRLTCDECKKDYL
jgi:hypothetical protein